MSNRFTITAILQQLNLTHFIDIIKKINQSINQEGGIQEEKNGMELVMWNFGS